jgi:hypothetical protein
MLDSGRLQLGVKVEIRVSHFRGVRRDRIVPRFSHLAP